jgi:hypothetical protein
LQLFLTLLSPRVVARLPLQSSIHVPHIPGLFFSIFPLLLLSCTLHSEYREVAYSGLDESLQNGDCTRHCRRVLETAIDRTGETDPSMNKLPSFAILSDAGRPGELVLHFIRDDTLDAQAYKKSRKAIRHSSRCSLSVLENHKWRA